MSDRSCQTVSTICVIGSNSECVPFVSDKPGFCRKKIIFIRNLQQNRKNALDKIPEMFVNCKQSSY